MLVLVYSDPAFKDLTQKVEKANKGSGGQRSRAV